MGWWWEEDRQILSCLQELALNALDFPGSFVKIFLLSIDAPVEVGLSSYKLWHMAIVLVVWFTLFWLVPPKREWLGHVRPRVTTQSLQQPRKSLSWKETWKKGLALQGHSGEKRECLHAFLFLWCFVHLHLSFFFFFPIKTTCSNFSTSKTWILSTKPFCFISQIERNYSFRNRFEYFFTQQK